MLAPATLASLLRRERIVIIAGLILTTAIAWAYMVHEARSMLQTGVCKCMGMAMAGLDTHEWNAAQFVALFLMWSEMMVAMMLPSAAPMILTFASVNRTRREPRDSYASLSAFVSGYLAIWILFSLAATFLQWGLHSAALLSPMMVSASPWLAGFLFIAAGIFQFTSWKTACLLQCANPLALILTHWRDGLRGALTMGLRHGLFCLGCCWALMFLLFAFGVMNVTWIAALTFYVLIEKLAGRHGWLGKVAGAVLCGWGLWTLSRSI